MNRLQSKYFFLLFMRSDDINQSRSSNLVPNNNGAQNQMRSSVMESNSNETAKKKFDELNRQY